MRKNKIKTTYMCRYAWVYRWINDPFLVTLGLFTHSLRGRIEKFQDWCSHDHNMQDICIKIVHNEAVYVVSTYLLNDINTIKNVLFFPWLPWQPYVLVSAPLEKCASKCSTNILSAWLWKEIYVSILTGMHVYIFVIDLMLVYICLKYSYHAKHLYNAS